MKTLDLVSPLLVAMVVSSCVPPPPHFMTAEKNAGMPLLNENGKFEDTADNRIFFYEAYRDLTEKEAADLFPEADWEEEWRMTIQAIEENNENPEWKKSAIRELRREAGLPIWSFMY